MAFQFGAALAAFLTAGSAPADAPAVTPATQQQVVVPLIEPAALKSMLSTKANFVLVDVRRPEEFAAGHIDGAITMPLDSLAANYASLPKNVTLVVYCRSGHRSAQAVQFLLAHGYSHAVSLNGGITAFAAAN